MRIHRLSVLLVVVAASGRVFAQGASGLEVRSTRPGASVTLERSLAEGKALVSVLDAKQDPMLGLTDKDFSVARANAAGKVTAVQPIAQNVEVPRHVVMVLDNSYSMVERKAIEQLLTGVGAVLKTLRPIDDTRLVVFRKQPVTMAGRKLHVETFQSNKTSELEAFVNAAYKKDHITEETVLYEAMFAGLDLIKGMPAGDPRFLLVFSDGEDLNSAFKGDVVSQAAQGIPNLHVFAIDYMPDPKLNTFLAGFASQNHGQARKAGSGADLLGLFQQFASRLAPYYVVSYEFAQAAAPAPKPAEPTAAAAQPAKAPAVAPAEPPKAEPTVVVNVEPAATQPPAAQPAAPAPAPEAKSNMWLWVLIVIVLILILFFALRRKDDDEKKK